MTEKYSIVRKLKKLPQAVPGKIIDGVSHDLNREKTDQLHTLQRESFIREEMAAKEIADQFPIGSVFFITRSCDQLPCGEATYEVTIRAKDNQKITFGPIQGKYEKRSYTAFCSETKLMIRNDQGQRIPNTELINQLKSNVADLPQIRSQSA